ncbi:MAG: Hpt domain-containing protein [Betaproteobacteria bacterium]|nr:Hpt domain-containing protein [Betaproteobacteria bacterium]
MNVATEFDVGPLTWVKNEVDLALERADLALQHFSDGVVDGVSKIAAGDLTQITFCRTHLHQVQGALTIVGLDGVTRFSEAVELLLEAIAQEKRPADAASIALARRSLAAVRHYLDDLIDGQPDQPLRLLSLYREVQLARGIERISATDLFFPDLSARPPRRETAVEALDPAELKKQLHLERARFQRGLLGWLKSPKDRSAVAEMLGAVKSIESTQELASARAFWWVAGGFLAALADGALPVEVGVKQLCARIDLQIRRLLEGSKNVAERLMRDTLYLVASADSNDSAVQQVKRAYRLQPIVPPHRNAPPAPLEAARRRLGEAVTAEEESWSKFCVGTAQALPVFGEHALAVQAVCERLGHTDLRRLAQATAAAANWLLEQPARHSETMAMEVATAIILTQNAQENFSQLGADFAHQVDVMVARIHGCIAGHPPQPGSEIPALDDMSRRAQEKLLVVQVAKEIQFNLAQIEPVLDAFFRGEGERGDLAALDEPLHQVVGALTMMRHEGAVEALRQCLADIRHFAAPEYVPREADFERVAEQLSVLGFYVDSLPHGTTDFAGFVRSMQSAGGSGSDGEELSPASVEQEVEQQKREAHALLEAIREQPDDSGLREELRQNLSALQKDADLVADKELVQQTRAVLSALESGGDRAARATHIDAAIATLKPQTHDAPTPSAATLELSQASAEEIDAELLAIFLEEAREVIGNVDAKLKRLAEQPHHAEALTHLRRSFHTLKGSGRMVGLRDLGEVAWSVEQVLNLWLRQELEVSQPLTEMLDLARDVFMGWVEHLESRSGATPRALPDTARLLALTGALRARDDCAMETALSGKNETPAPDAAPEPEKPDYGAEIIRLEFPATPVAVPGDTVVGAKREAAAEHVDLADFDLIPPDTEPPPPPLPPAGTDSPQPRISVSSTLYDIFREEANGHLATLQRECAALQADPEQMPHPEMYRAAHTLGGIAATVGLAPINRLGLALEHALLRRTASAGGTREGRMATASPGALETMGLAIAEFEKMLAAVKDRGQPEGAPHLVFALDGLYVTPLEERLAEAADHPEGSRIETGERSGGAARDERPPARASALLPEPADHADSPPAAGDVPASAGPTPVAGAAADARQISDELDEQVLPIFLEEAIELNQKIAGKLRAWRANPADGEVAHTLARLLHTLKGSARMAGAMNLGEITHAIETRVEETRRSGSAPPALIDEIDGAFDAIRQIVDRLLRGEALDLPGEPAGVAAAPAPETPGAALPATAQEAPPAAVAQAGETVHEAAMLRVRADLIDRLVNEAGELSIARSRIEGEMRGLKESLLDLTENVIRLRRQLREIEIQAESQMQSRAAHAEEGTPDFDPLEFDRFTRFQELARMMAESVNDVGTVQQVLLKNVDEANAAILAQARLNRELQQELMNIRMVPFDSISDRLYRVVRQTAKELGKRANLEIKGGQLEVDRSVLEKIAAPLEHMLRNAIVHGLETREKRLATGKPEIGEIALGLVQEGNQIVLSLTDDGAGLDFGRVRERAIAAGLLAPEKGTDTATLVDVIFAPGLTTASELSQIAGRGVGLDVVKTEVTSLGGRIEVGSKAGGGTTFRLYIPLTLALTQALLVRAGSKLYAVPSVMIAQLLDLKEDAIKRIREAREVEWMNERYPFGFLPHLLGDSGAEPETHRQYWVLLLRSGNRRVAVQIDEPRGNQEIVVKNIGQQLARVAGIDGATVLGNGQVVLILNPIALTGRLPNAAFAAPVALVQEIVEAGAALPAVPAIMVVDDSLTVRKFTTRLLVREGYRVITAKDGVEALEHLADFVPDVMLVDIEMPRMDGFDLTRNIRADARLKDVPIIIITSRTADKHRNYAFQIGVNQYLGKPYREEELLQLVGGYVKREPAAT